jgi:hypothetical protein
MRLSFRPATRLPAMPPAVVAATLVWAALVLGVGLLARARGLTATVCLFKNLTGLPCPGCGGTRMALALLDGRPAEAFILNPLLAAAGCALLPALALRAALARAPRLELSVRERRAAWIAGAALLAGNWAYLIARGI